MNLYKLTKLNIEKIQVSAYTSKNQKNKTSKKLIQ